MCRSHVRPSLELGRRSPKIIPLDLEEADLTSEASAELFRTQSLFSTVHLNSSGKLSPLRQQSSTGSGAEAVGVSMSSTLNAATRAVLSASQRVGARHVHPSMPSLKETRLVCGLNDVSVGTGE